ncbi:MAG: hypothetical protein RL011_2007 [Pseudomonadota bacterium]
MFLLNLFVVLWMVNRIKISRVVIRRRGLKMRKSIIARMTRKTFKFEFVAVLLSISVGCSGGNQSNFSESGSIYQSVSEKEVTEFLNVPKLTADEQKVLDKMPMSKVFLGADLKIPAGASVVIAGKRIANFDKVYAQWQSENMELAKKFRTWGEYRKESERLVANPKYKLATVSLKKVLADEPTNYLNLVTDGHDVPSYQSLQLIGDNAILSMAEKALEATKSCVGNIGTAVGGLAASAWEARKSFAAWNLRKLNMAAAAPKAIQAAGGEAGLGAEGAAAVGRAAVAEAAEVGIGGVAGAAGLAVLGAYATYEGVRWAVKHCRNGSTTTHDTEAEAIKAANDSIAAQCKVEEAAGDQCHQSQHDVNSINGSGGSDLPVQKVTVPTPRPATQKPGEYPSV